MLATGSDDRTIRLWDTETGDKLHVLPAHLDRINAIAFSPDGRTLIGADESGAVSFSNVRTGQFLFRRKVSENEILDLALSHDSTHLALAIKNAPAMLIRLKALKAKQTKEDRTVTDETVRSLSLSRSMR
jgi:WD40 repeat protein